MIAEKIKFKGLIRKNEVLKGHSYIRIGGTADLYAEPQNLDELKEVFRYCRSQNIPFHLFGGGCNTLFDDAGYRGCLISMVRFDRSFFQVEGSLVKVSAGVRTFSFVKKCHEHNLTGMEFLSFIPGTMGGVLAMNAGCLDYTAGNYREIGAFVEEVTVWDGADIKHLTKENIVFRYRGSSLKEFIVLYAKLKFEVGRVEELKKELSRHLKLRSEKMPMDKPTLGSMFKNPVDLGMSAGKLIEEAGLKGLREGDVEISRRHANVFENLGNGTSRDVLVLIQKVQEAVKKKFNINLELEIDYIK